MKLCSAFGKYPRCRNFLVCNLQTYEQGRLAHSRAPADRVPAIPDMQDAIAKMLSGSAVGKGLNASWRQAAEA